MLKGMEQSHEAVVPPVPIDSAAALRSVRSGSVLRFYLEYDARKISVSALSHS